MAANTLTVAAIQMDIMLGERRKNLIRAEGAIAEAARKGAQAVILPELWTTGYALRQIAALAEQPDNEKGAVACLQKLAQRHSLYIGGGSVPEMVDGRVYNASYTIAPDGTILSRYAKQRLFPLMDEHIYMEPGVGDGLATTEYGVWGSLICFDLRFPDLARRLVEQGGATILWLPSEWPNPRMEHWRVLAQARAIEDQCFVVACNRVGRDEHNTFFGHSLIIDPWGVILAEGSEGEEIVLATLELDAVAAVRSRIPCLKLAEPAAV